MIFVLRALVLGVSVLPVAEGTETRPFPLERTAETELGELLLSPDHAAIASLRELHRVVLTGVPLPTGERIVLELERIDLGRLRFGFRVDGRPEPGLLDGLGSSSWTGRVGGSPGSHVMIAFGHYGSHGWIEHDGQTFHLIGRPTEEGDYLLGSVLVTTDDRLARSGLESQWTCGLDALLRFEGEAAPRPPSIPKLQISSGGPCALKECTVAMETDFVLFEVFNGDLNAMTTYVTTLLSFVSNRYETQLNTILTFPYLQFYTNLDDDPWTSQYQGGNSFDLLLEFRSAWINNIPAGARLAHFMSGAQLGGGMAWGSELCSEGLNFAVSGSINGEAGFPIQQSPTNWDFALVAHELGHNFGALHTNQYCPPLDTCVASSPFGPCPRPQVCTTEGTIMSLCSLCPGGMANITTFFHPAIADLLSSKAQECLPDYLGGIMATVPDFVDPGVTNPIGAAILGSPRGPVELVHRVNGGAWRTLPMGDQGGGQWSGELPPVSCSDDVDVYVQYTDVHCGLLTDPIDAPDRVYSPQVGSPEGCQDPWPTSYCTDLSSNSVSPFGSRLLHSSGVPGSLMVVGLEDVPLTYGVLFFGTQQVDQPFGCGRLCVQGSVLRSGVLVPDAHSVRVELDTRGIATTPFNIQYWYRDPAWEQTCGSTFNFSNALAY